MRRASAICRTFLLVRAFSINSTYAYPVRDADRSCCTAERRVPDGACRWQIGRRFSQGTTTRRHDAGHLRFERCSRRPSRHVDPIASCAPRDDCVQTNSSLGVRPEGGARCVSSARRDPCGGRGAILVPAATTQLIHARTSQPVARTESSLLGAQNNGNAPPSQPPPTAASKTPSTITALRATSLIRHHAEMSATTHAAADVSPESRS